MSKRKPEMTVTLNHDALVDAIESYTQNLMGTSSTVSNVNFTAGRGDKGYSADVTLSLNGESDSDTNEKQAPKPTGPTKRKNKPGPKPKQETEEPAPDDDEADIASSDSEGQEGSALPADDGDTKEETTSSPNQKRLFGSDS